MGTTKVREREGEILAPEDRSTPSISGSTRSFIPTWVRTSTKWIGLLQLYWAVAIVFQLFGGAFANEFGGHSDEPSHYVTGLMVREYLVGTDWRHPMRFAEDYYRHYPKVALGHWPPFFYALQAAWTIPFGTSRASLLLLMSLVTALLAVTLHLEARRTFGPGIALFAGLLFVALPLTQLFTDMLMADVLTGLFCFWATSCFGRFLDSASWRSAVGFGLLASLAILTKGNGLALALLPPTAIVLSRRWRLLVRPAFWFPVAIVLVLAGPWTYFTLHMSHGGFTSSAPTWEFTGPALAFYSWCLPKIVGTALLVLAFIGLAVRLAIPWWGGGAESKWAAYGALLLGTWIFHWVVPVNFEMRYLIPAVPALLLFLAAGALWTAERIPGAWPARQKQAVMGIAVLVAFAAETFTVPKAAWRGFQPVANGLLARPESEILISSDPHGEGMFVAEMAARRHEPAPVILRGSKTLGASDWLGRHYVSFCRTPAEMLKQLEKLQVKTVVLDTSAPLENDMVHHRLLAETLDANPERWQPVRSYDIVRQSVEFPRSVRIYRRLGDNGGAKIARVD